jgi:hypothetical protein
LITPLDSTQSSYPVDDPVLSRSLHANPMPPEIHSEADLMPPGGTPGTVPTDLEQATGLERLEILGKMQGVDVFDMRPLDASRRGTYCAFSNHQARYEKGWAVLYPRKCSC